MSKILVTGANGFIGQHLVHRLLKEGHAVRCLKKEDIPLRFFKEKNVEWRMVDFYHPDSLSAVCEGIDIVYHLAAIPRNDLRKTRDDFFSVNVQGTRRLLDEAIHAKVKRFVFISTVEAAGFGDGTHPRKESDPPHPDNLYGKSKLEAENVVMNGNGAIECVTVRLPMIYGPGTLLIVPKLFGMVKKGVYPLIGRGNTLMEFCFVENAVEGIILAGTKKEAVNQVFYLSDERPYSIKEVINSIAAAMEKQVLFLHVPERIAYVFALLWEAAAAIFPFPPLVSLYSKKPFFTRETVWWTTRNVNVVSTEKIRHLLGYTPSVSIQEGCRKTVHWLRGEKII